MRRSDEPWRRAAQRSRRGFGKSQEAHLTLLDQLRHRADGFLDGNAGVHSMLVVEIDLFDAQPPQACLAGLLHVLRAPIHAQKLAIG
jgi:hypothetical protein